MSTEPIELAVNPVRRQREPRLPFLKKIPTSRYWYIQIPCYAGKRDRRYSTGTTDREEAEKMLAECPVEDIMRAQRGSTIERQMIGTMLTGRKVRYRQAVEEYLAHIMTLGQQPRSITNATTLLDHFAREFQIGLRPIGAIPPETINEFVNATGINYFTRQFRLFILRPFFDYCKHRNWIAVSPCLDLVVKTADLAQGQLIQKKKIPFTADEVQKILSVIPRDSSWYGMVLIGADYGLRLSDAAALEWVNFGDMTRLTVFTRKGKRVVDEPLTERCREWFSSWPHMGTTGLVFPDMAASVSLSPNFRRICDRAGLMSKSFHCLRCMVFQNKAEAVLADFGGEERAKIIGLFAEHGMRAVQQMLGHAPGSKSTGRYLGSKQD